MNRILGLDFGRARIGVAISDELQLLAHPFETISATQQPAARIAEIVREKKVERVVAGIPRQMNGQIGTAATEALDFVEKLRALLPCPIVTWDERLTTVAAHRALRDAGKKTRNTRGYVDQVAAQMILQSYLDSLAPEKAADEQ
jgi:putative pre-16S rRNA nuclease